MAERSPTSRPKDSSMDHPTSSAKCAVFNFTKKWIHFTSRDKSIIVMVSENKNDGGHPLKIKGNKEEYPGIKAAKPHKNPSNIEVGLIANYSQPEKEQNIFFHEISRSAAGQIGPEGHRSSTLVVDGPSSLKGASFAVEGGGGGSSHFSFHGPDQADPS
ncbi:unnamed protein product [Darwinula stevensoni]|uniref:Uncharacterized protein n=1 Tax=Darwinula stevensoni TaxID=69355 RepID=A0A7R9AII6_9CRUS|nr:unnamed protein product [Darwinula stevensoni]CAG0905617.1 unnamed protein product [Darwinula stevensoni]